MFQRRELQGQTISIAVHHYRLDSSTKSGLGRKNKIDEMSITIRAAILCQSNHASPSSNSNRVEGDAGLVSSSTLSSLNMVRYIYYALCPIPLIIFPSCFGQFGSPSGGLIRDGIMAIVLITILSPLLTFLGILVAAFAPRGSKTGPLVGTAIAAFPGLYLLIAIPLSK